MSQGKPRKKWLLEQAKKDHKDIMSYDKMEGSNLHNYIEKEFNLSEKIVGENIPSNDFIHKLDVKEFIKLLKVKMPFLDVYQLGILNKLAGDDLV